MHPRFALLTLFLLSGLPAALHAQHGTCTSGNATADLNVNNVRARLYNNGGLFWKGGGAVYNVPRAAQGQLITPNGIFAAGIWMGGRVNGQVRAAAADYSNWELWPGPLGAQGQAPADCAPYDRIFSIRSADLAAYEATGTPTPDLRDWPWQWGAPVVDGDGDPNNYDLAGGDRPELLGNETHWWVMNDAGNLKNSTGTLPLGMEVQVTAFAADLPGALSTTTFYRYKLVYHGAQPLADAYVGLWVDADLGNATDDYVGADLDLDMGFVYNADDDDEGTDGYGQAPPALGVTFLEGLNAGASRNLDVFLYYDNFTAPNGNPRNATDDWYNYLRGVWQDGKPMVACGDGYHTTGLACAASARPTNVMWPGDPVTGAFWSERNMDGAGNANPPSDRRFLMSTGPFAMQPGETKSMVFAIVWARGADHLDSVTRLRAAAVDVRTLWAQTGLKNVQPPAPPSARASLRAPADGSTDQPAEVALYWAPVAQATVYDVRVTTPGVDTTVTAYSSPLMVDLNALGVSGAAGVSWQVRGRNAGGAAPWSPAFSFSTTGAALSGVLGGFSDFLTVANAAGPLSPPEYGAFAFNNSGFPHPTTADRPNGARQQHGGGLTDSQAWGIHTFGTYTTYAEWLDRVTRSGANLARIQDNVFEWRFTGSSVAVRRFEDQGVVTVPFELWNIGTTPDDPQDDYRMIPVICESACGAGKEQGTFDIGGDSPLSGAENDPITDAVYWYDPLDMSPGTAGYDAYAADVAAGDAARFYDHVGEEVLARIVLMGWNFGTATDTYPQTTPEAGTVFRLVGQSSMLSAPVPSGPVAAAVQPTTAVTLYWNAPRISTSGAPQQTQVQVALDADFNTVVKEQVVSSGQTSLALWGFDAGQTYYWRVQQQVGALSGPWSAVASFRIDATATAAEQDATLPEVLTLAMPAPHPVHGRAQVRFGTPAAGEVRVMLYDVLGREVRVLARGDYPAGWHAVPLDAGALASGLYLVRVTAGGQQQSRTVVVAR